MTTRPSILLAAAVVLANACSTVVAGATIVVDQSHVKPDRATGMIRIELPPVRPGNDAGRVPSPIVGLKDVEGVVFNWHRRGSAAGHRGDLYDNRDRDHSNMRPERFPQLTFVEYDEALKKRNVDYGVQPGLLFNRVTIGNSSTARSGPLWRSNARDCYTNPRLARAMILQYVNNHIYVYPEHRDHDPGHNGTRPGAKKEGHGDVFPVNTPYVVISQGSSRSDAAFLDALACTLAAYRPEVKKQLTERRMIAPVTQWILRRTYGDTRTREDYLSGSAHPTVFQGERLNRRLMVEMAQKLSIDDVPPLARLTVETESVGEPGVDYAATGPAERLLNSPFAVGRIHRSARRTYAMVVNAKPFPAADNTVAKTKFEWSLLRGDPQRVRITPLADDGSRVRIEVDYHERMPVKPGGEMASSRVDIGCFADNGKLLSAPSFVTIYSMDSERRTYDGDGRVVEIAHDAHTLFVDVEDWGRLVRHIAGAGPDAYPWLARGLSDRELDDVRRVAREYVAAVDEAMKQPANPTRERLLENAGAVLDKDQPALGGSLRRVIRRGIDTFTRTPDSINTIHEADDERLAELRKAHPRDPWVAQLKSALGDGLIREPAGAAGRFKVTSNVDWPDGNVDRLTGSEAHRIERLNADLLRRLMPAGAIRITVKRNYVDPVLSMRTTWRDTFRYAPGVADPVGWTRHRPGAEPERFTAQGWRVTETDAKGRPLTAVEVTYEREGVAPNAKLVQKDTPTRHRFEYTGPDDHVGRVVNP